MSGSQGTTKLPNMLQGSKTAPNIWGAGARSNETRRATCAFARSGRPIWWRSRTRSWSLCYLLWAYGKDCGTAVGVNVGHALYVLAIFPIRGEVNGGLLTLGGRLYGRRIWEVEDLRPLGSWVKRGNTNPLAL